MSVSYPHLYHDVEGVTAIRVKHWRGNTIIVQEHNDFRIKFEAPERVKHERWTTKLHRNGILEFFSNLSEDERAGLPEYTMNIYVPLGMRREIRVVEGI